MKRAVDIIDYYHAERIGSLPVVSFEDTNLCVSLKWNEITE